jgi:hypothetical protein
MAIVSTTIARAFINHPAGRLSPARIPIAELPPVDDPVTTGPN